jgi:hypothetical protein
MFIVDIIKSILNSDSNMSAEARLDKISEIIANFEYIEQVALKYALEEGRKTPDSDDRLKAIEIVAAEKKINLEGVNSKKLKPEIRAGIKWLKKFIQERQGWKISQDIKPEIFKNEPPEPIRPTEMILTSPWEIGMTISTFWDWHLFTEGKEDFEAAHLIQKGKAYLKKIQDILGTGGLGDSLWLSEEANRYEPDAIGNTWETAMTIAVWNLPPEPETQYQDAIAWGRKFILNNLNDDGGWGFKQGLPSDLKSTAMGFFSFLTQREGPKRLFERKMHTHLSRGLDWIINHQQPDGSWDSLYRSRDSAILASFYAVPALLTAKKLARSQSPGEGEEKRSSPISPSQETQINVALGKALRWFESSTKYVHDEEKTGWAWDSGVENTAVALIALMDAGWKDKDATLVQKTLDWLQLNRDPKNFWGVTTPIVLKAMMRIAEPKMRLATKLDLIWKS